MRYILFLLASVLLFAGCKKDATIASLPDITGGLVVNIPFDSSTIETVSNTVGKADTVLYTTGHTGKAHSAIMFLDGSMYTVDYGALPAASFTNNIFTISFWVKTQDTALVGGVISKRSVTGPWEYCIDNHFSHGYYSFDNWLADGSTTVYGADPLKAYASIAPNYTWQHIAYVADGAMLHVYVNGVLQQGIDMHATGMNFTATTAHLVIGDGGGYGRHYYFSGCIDDIKMYNRALTADAIQYLATH